MSTGGAGDGRYPGSCVRRGHCGLERDRPGAHCRGSRMGPPHSLCGPSPRRLLCSCLRSRYIGCFIKHRCPAAIPGAGDV